MTSVIRSVRLAEETKALPLISASRGGHSRETPTPLTSARSAAPADAKSGPAERNLPMAPKSPVSIPVTYEEYKQRFVEELSALRQQILESTREEALQQGRLAAETESRQRLDGLQTLMESMRSGRQHYVEDLADDIAEIVLAAVAQILGEGFIDQRATVAVVREAIQRCRERDHLVVRVAPQDFEVLHRRRSELTAGTGGQAIGIELVSDQHVKLGGCVLEGSLGSLDGRLEAQLQRLRATLISTRAQWGKSDE